MVGSAGPTMVWSRAPRNRPSMTAQRISIFARWLRPSAGSSASVGRARRRRRPGTTSMTWSIPSVGVAGCGLCLAVVGDRGVIVERGGDGSASERAAHRRRARCRRSRGDAAELGRGRRSRTVAEELVAQGVARQHPSPAGVIRTRTTRRSSGRAIALDEAALLHPVDEPGGVRERDVEQVGQPAHRHLAVVLEQVHDVELGHADAEPDAVARSPTHLSSPSVARKSAMMVPAGSAGDRRWLRRGRVDSSCHVNYHTRHERFRQHE